MNCGVQRLAGVAILVFTQGSGAQQSLTGVNLQNQGFAGIHILQRRGDGLARLTAIDNGLETMSDECLASRPNFFIVHSDRQVSLILLIIPQFFTTDRALVKASSGSSGVDYDIRAIRHESRVNFDGCLAFNRCRCNELGVLHRQISGTGTFVVN